MRITFVLPEANLSGGVRVVATYADLLKRRGHQVVVVSVPPFVPTVRERIRALLREGRWLPRGDGGSHLDGVDVEHRVLHVRRAVVDGDVPDADVVIATWWETAEQVARLSPCKGAKVYFLQHDETEFYAPDDVASRDQIRSTLRLPMHKIAVSRWIADRCEPSAGGPIAVIHNAVDHARFTGPPRGKRPQPTIGAIYSDVAFKGFDVAQEAVRLAQITRPDLRFVVFGAEPAGRRIGLTRNTAFTLRPEQDQIPRLYASCDAWLFASRSEGFGLPVLEAMACRTPVIAAPAGIASEVVADGGGILLPRSDPRAMADAILTFAAISQEEWRMRSTAAHAAAAEYTWTDSLQRLESQLARAVADRTPAPTTPSPEEAACPPAR